MRDLTDEEWEDFKDIIRLTRSRDSGYTVVLKESRPGNSDLMMSSVSLYNLMTWLHHYVAKDSTSELVSKLALLSHNKSCMLSRMSKRRYLMP